MIHVLIDVLRLTALVLCSCLAFLYAPKATAAAGLIGLAWVAVARWRRRRRERKRGWRVGHEGRDSMYYEEADSGGVWRRLELGGEMIVVGKAHHAIYLPGEGKWRRESPDWAKERREEIVERIRGELRPPGYLYCKSDEEDH